MFTSKSENRSMKSYKHKDIFVQLVVEITKETEMRTTQVCVNRTKR